MKKITPFLWYNNEAEEAANFYTSIFKNSKLKEVSRYGEGAPFPAGSVMSASFELEGQEFVALNGGPAYSFTPAVSFLIDCKNQEEVDYYWDKLSDGGKIDMCGWLRDKYGLSWQVVPSALGKMLADKDKEKAKKVMQAMLTMKKLDVNGLEEAYNS